MKRDAWLVVLASALVSACSGETEQLRPPDLDASVRGDAPTVPSDAGVATGDTGLPEAGLPEGTAWAQVAGVPGAFHRSLPAAGNDALLFYGGCGANDDAVQGFTDELAKSSAWKRTPRHLYAVKWTSSGCGYDGAFKNSALGPLVVADVATDGRVTVLAHSSGAYVAHEWIAQAIGVTAPAWDGAHTLQERIAYANLDGGGDANLTKIEGAKGKPPMIFVGAHDSVASLQSRNYATMQALGTSGRFVIVDAKGSGCTAPNCMHDTVVTTLPHNTKSFVDAQGTSQPLWCDYQHFPSKANPTCEQIDAQTARAATRRVVDSYLSRLP